MRANYEITAAIFAGLVLGAIAMPVVSAGSAYADDIVRVRGTIASVDGSTYVVKTRDGAEQKVARQATWPHALRQRGGTRASRRVSVY